MSNPYVDYNLNPSIWESRIVSTDVPFAHYTKDGSLRHFYMVAQPIEQPILSNVWIKGLGYNGSTPGPIIVMQQGETIALTVENRMNDDTALHVHGLSKPNPQDGVPEIEPNNPKISLEKAILMSFYVGKAGRSFIILLCSFKWLKV